MTMETVQQGFGALQTTEDDVISHSTDIFSLPSTEIAMLAGDTLAYRPTNLDSIGPYHFVINPQGNKVLHLNTARLWIKARVVTGDNTKLISGVGVNLVNNFIGSFCDKVEIALDGADVGLSNNHLNYKQYVETLISYGNSARESHLQAGGWHVDEANQFEFSATNTSDGITQRTNIIKDSNEFTLMAPIHADLLHTDRQFPPGIALSVIITRASDKFLLQAKDDTVDYKLQIIEMKLFIRHITLTDSATSGMLQKIKTEPISLPFNKTIIKSITQSSSISDLTLPNVIQGSIPKSLLIYMTVDGADSKYELNPYNFQTFSLINAYIRVNGKTIPSEPYTPNFTMSHGYSREYRDFFDNIGISHDDHGNAVSMSMYKGGAFFIAFDLSPDLCNGYHKHLHRTGTIDLFMKTSKPLTKSVRVFIHATYDGLLQITPDKQCKVFY